jgi:zinc transporter ZupT
MIHGSTPLPTTPWLLITSYEKLDLRGKLSIKSDLLKSSHLGMDLGITYGWPESHGVRDSKYGGDQLSSGNLMKRGSSSCGRDLGEDAPDYNMPLHIAALFIILAVSSLACAFPVFAVRFPRLRIPSWFLFLARHFGTGVLVATAFVHLLPTAFESLTDPCLSFFWNKKYPPMPGAISMAAIFLVIVIEQVFSRGHHGCSGAGLEQLNKSYAEGDRSSGEANKQGIVAGNPVLTCSGSNSSIENQNEGLAPLTEEQKHKKELLQCLLLEMGILFHSIFIGMTISVSVGSDFVVLLIAIAFHRKFLCERLHIIVSS